MQPPEVLYRRLAPRIGVESLCTELVEGVERSVIVVDLAPGGLRIERPYVPGPTPPEVTIELEVPDLDEVIWARAAVCFDQIRPAPSWQHGRYQFVRTTGLRFVAAASRDLRMLRDCVLTRATRTARRRSPLSALPPAHA